MSKIKDIVIDKLKERGVTIADMAVLAIEVQKGYVELNMEQATASIEAVLSNREVQHSILTGIQLDELAEKGLVDEPLLSIMKGDDPLYGVDETLAFGITNVYGTIGITNFGYLDKVKPGIIGELDNQERNSGSIHVFLDDLVAAVIAAACSKAAHDGFD